MQAEFHVAGDFCEVGGSNLKGPPTSLLKRKTNFPWNFKFIKELEWVL